MPASTMRSGADFSLSPHSPPAARALEPAATRGWPSQSGAPVSAGRWPPRAASLTVAKGVMERAPADRPMRKERIMRDFPCGRMFIGQNPSRTRFDPAFPGATLAARRLTGVPLVSGASMTAAQSQGRPVYVVDGARTPFLKARGGPGPFTPVDLAIQCGRPLLLRQPFAPDAF